MKRLLTLTLLCVATAQAAAPVADPVERSCARVLEHSPRLHDPQRLLDPASQSLRLRDWLCQSGFTTPAELARAGQALNLPDPGLGTLFGTLLPDEPQAFRQALAERCRSGYQLQTNPLAKDAFRRSAAVAMTNAYTACLARLPQALLRRDGAYVYAEPRDAGLERFRVRVRGAAQPPRIVDGGSAHCGSPEGAAGDYRFDCRKAADQATRLRLQIDPEHVSTLVLPGRGDMELARLAESQLILADRLAGLERALSETSSEQQAEPSRQGQGGFECPRDSYVIGISNGPDGLRPRCRRLPPNAP